MKSDNFYINTIKDLKTEIKNMEKNSSLVLSVLLGVISYYQWGDLNISITCSALAYLIISRLITI